MRAYRFSSEHERKRCHQQLRYLRWTGPGIRAPETRSRRMKRWGSMYAGLRFRNRGERRNRHWRQNTTELVDYAMYLIRTKLWVHRQGKNFRSNALRYREAALAIAEPLVSRLQMQRDGVVNSGADLGRVKMLLQCVARGNTNNIQMINGAAVRCRVRPNHAIDVAQQLVIKVSRNSALLVPVRQVAKLDGEHTGLQGIEP